MGLLSLVYEVREMTVEQMLNIVEKVVLGLILLVCLLAVGMMTYALFL